MNDNARPGSILVIRRDNIGDLVCTTPLLASLRRQLPAARIDVLVTRYNRDVLAGNPDVTSVYDYVKAKHREPGESLLGIYARRFAAVLEMRRHNYDYALLPGGHSASAARFARWIAPRRIVAGDAADGHEVERCCRLLEAVGLDYETPPTHVVPDPLLVQQQRRRIGAAAETMPQRLLALHVSARKPSQRWPAQRFAALAHRLYADDPRRAFVLLWSPGAANNPLHPGDDDKAAEILAATAGLPIHPVATARLGELIAALSLCEGVVCADGGAMHLAAGLGKPVAALFGQSDAARWHPWSIPYVVLQPESRDVSDVSVEEAVAAVALLSGRL